MRLPYPVRTLGHRLLRWLPVRIRTGPNRGLRWSVVTMGRGFGSGRFGRDRLDALAALTREGDTFWDVGAHKGYVTLAASRMVGPSGRVVAFEPSRTNRSFLDQHLLWNSVSNVEVHPLALSDTQGEARFGGRGSSIAFRLGTGDETVAVATLRSLVAEGGVRPPNVMKIDVEGEEGAVLAGAGPHLRGDLAMLISTHSREHYNACRKILDRNGFKTFVSWEIEERLDDSRPWSSDHDIVAIGPERELDEARIRALPLIRGPSA